MIATVSRIAAFLLFVSAPLVNSHAVLVSPSPWNANPSTTKYCGVATVPTTTTTTTYKAGDQVSLTWKVIAGDGAGLVSAWISTTTPNATYLTTARTTSTTNTPLTLSGQTTPTTTGTFTIQMTIPTGLACPSKGCTLSIGTGSWFSCASLNITTANAASSGTSTSGCTTASGLVTCQELNGKSLMNLGVPFATQDASVNATLNQDLPNRNVFTVGNSSSTCVTKYTSYLCAQNFPACGQSPTGACNSRCSAVQQYCVVNASHAGLFTCNNSVTADAIGSCKSAVNAQSFTAVLLSFIAIAILLVSF